MSSSARPDPLTSALNSPLPERSRILIVDDLPANVDILAKMLGEDYDIRFATSGPEALEQVALQVPDLVLLDVMMPGMNGFEVARHLRNHSDWQGIPVVFVTAMNDDDAESQGLKLGAVDYLTKPIRPGIARLRIRNVLERERLRAEVTQHRDHLLAEVAARTAELRLSEARYRSLVEQSLAGIYIIDGDYFSFCNAYFAELLGYDAPEQIVNRLSVLSLVAEEDRDRVAEQIRRRQCGEAFDARYTFTALRRDQLRLPVEVHAHVLELDGQRLIIGLLQDASERQRAEIAQSMALAEAEHLSRLKSDFITNVTHELRTPLNGILGMAHLGQRAKDLEKAHHACAVLQQSGEQLLRIIENILDFSHLERGQFQIQPKVVQLLHTLEQLLTIARDRAKTKGLAFQAQFAPSFPHQVLLDPQRLLQVLGQLLDNAIKFTESGQVTFAAQHFADTLEFTITDTGIGMSQIHLDRLFQPFEQAESGIQRRFGGTGLGLALTRHLILHMNGTIRIDSTPGQGTKCVVRLPWIQATLPQPATGRLQGLAVLLMDHNEISRMILSTLLEDEGAQVTCEQPQSEWLERLQQEYPAFDLAIVRLSSLYLNLDHLVTELAARFPTVPRIAMLDEEAPELLERCHKAGIREMLTDPINLEDLVTAALRLQHAAPL